LGDRVQWKQTSFTLGTVTYTKAQALSIIDLAESLAGKDASVFLGAEMIAAELNIAFGVDGSSIAATLADANSLLGSGTIPESIKYGTPLYAKMQADFHILQAFNTSKKSCKPPPPAGSCQPSSSLPALISGTNVTAYVPKGAWGTSATGLSVINVEGGSITPKLIATPDVVNSCASNSKTGQTVCSANNTDVYLLSGTTLGTALTSGGSGTIGFSGGSCTNCGVTMDGVNNKALIGLSVSGAPGFQLLDLASSTFGAPFASPSGQIAEDPLVIPVQSSPPYPASLTLPLLLSPSEINNYEIAGNAESGSPVFFESPIPFTGFGEGDSAGMDCATGIALAPGEFSSPSQVFIADLTQAKFTAGSPGTWTAPSQVQTLSESVLPAAGPIGFAIAQGTHRCPLG
jgi:hypothetical protein